MNPRRIILYALGLLLVTGVAGGVFLYRRAKKSAVFIQSDTAETTAVFMPFVPPMPPADTYPSPHTAAIPESDWIPLLRNPDIFYDPARAELRLGEATADSVTVDYFYSAHTLALSDAGIKQPARRVPINDGVLREIAIDGSTLTLICEQGRFLLHDPTDNTYRLTDPKALYETIVIIDPGHGGRDEGAVLNGVRERDINLDIVLRLLDIFDNQRVLLLPTRTNDTDVDKDDRYALANDIGDYFISVHNNVDERNKRTHGTQTYFHPHESETPITSEAMALLVQQVLSTRLGSRDRGIERSDVYRVLINTTIPAVLTEVLFLSNDEEFARLTDPACRQEIAMALAEAIDSLPPARNGSEQ